uniref:Secreted protein n=1 Tax=Aegilops tauschii subsp. strangulata TaxID=200361 RepID=A0A453PL77_AEGTS
MQSRCITVRNLWMYIVWIIKQLGLAVIHRCFQVCFTASGDGSVPGNFGCVTCCYQCCFTASVYAMNSLSVALSTHCLHLAL